MHANAHIANQCLLAGTTYHSAMALAILCSHAKNTARYIGISIRHIFNTFVYKNIFVGYFQVHLMHKHIYNTKHAWTQQALKVTPLLSERQTTARNRLSALMNLISVRCFCMCCASVYVCVLCKCLHVCVCVHACM